MAYGRKKDRFVHIKSVLLIHSANILPYFRIIVAPYFTLFSNCVFYIFYTLFNLYRRYKGKPLKGWERENRKDSDIRMLREKNIRYVSYNELISNSLKGYDAFLEKSKEISRIQKLINDL